MPTPDEILNATSVPPDRVASPSRIAFFVGNPPQQMQIFSGVAVLNFESGGRTNHRIVNVIIGSVSTRNIQFTAKADLASIFNSDSEFLFAVDSATVINDEHSGQLSLQVVLGVQGNESKLLRFSYHVQVLSDIVDTLIAGTIRWRESLGSPSAAAQAGSPIFRVDAGNIVQDPSGTGFGSAHFQSARSGNSLGTAVLAGGFWAVAYQINAVPLGPNFNIIPVLLHDLLLNLPDGTTESSFEFIPAPRFVQLTPAAPTAVGVDFEMILSQGPK